MDIVLASLLLGLIGVAFILTHVLKRAEGRLERLEELHTPPMRYNQDYLDHCVEVTMCPYWREDRNTRFGKDCDAFAVCHLCPAKVKAACSAKGVSNG